MHLSCYQEGTILEKYFGASPAMEESKLWKNFHSILFVGPNIALWINIDLIDGLVPNLWQPVK